MFLGLHGSGSNIILNGFGSGSSGSNKQKSKKYLEFYYFETLLDFLSMKTDVNLPGSGMEKIGSGIRDYHPRSATL
jgi:hypothetical protein